MKRVKPGFTLIELLMVVLVIGLLVVMLVPAIGAATRAVRTSMTESMIWEISSAIDLYKDTFGDYPPSGKPADADWSQYPDGWVPDDPSAAAAGVGYGPFEVKRDYAGQGDRTPPGGQYLTYFLFGPTRFGWTRDDHQVNVEWSPPAGLERYLTDKPLRNIGTSTTYPLYGTPAYWFFEDAFGLTGYKFRGAILYLCANTQNREPMVAREREHPRFVYEHIEAEYNTACRGGSWGYTGDNEPQKNLARLLKQCTKGFALISAGADHQFGYRARDTHGNNRDREGADYRKGKGISDDITNFVHD